MEIADPPFLVLSLPRSRSYWTSRFLTFHGRAVGHDIFIDMSSKDDILRYFSQPGAAACDTALGHKWVGLTKILPHVRIAVITRPVDQVIKSFEKLGLTEPAFVGWLRQYEKTLAEFVATGQCHNVTFEALNSFQGASELFEYCLDAPLSRGRWERFNGKNLQCDTVASLTRIARRAKEIDALFASLDAA